MRWILWLVFVALVVLSGCSEPVESGGEATSASTAVPSSSATAPTTTTAPATTTTTVAAATTTTTAPTTTSTQPPTTTTTVDVFFSIAAHGLHPAPLPGSGGWFGSGCSPGSDTLPDGIWWGYITDLSPSSITFDLTCLVWIVDPDSEGGRWTIENNNSKLRAVPVAPAAQVICQYWECPRTPFPYDEWIADDGLPRGDGEREDMGLWIYINNGAVTEVGIEELAG
jgi:hypothetical protein